MAWYSVQLDLYHHPGLLCRAGPNMGSHGDGFTFIALAGWRVHCDLHGITGYPADLSLSLAVLYHAINFGVMLLLGIISLFFVDFHLNSVFMFFRRAGMTPVETVN
jgi:hypothetical protein